MFLIMFTLKLCGVITLSWWLVCSPLLVLAGLMLLVLMAAILIILLKACILRRINKEFDKKMDKMIAEHKSVR